MTVSPVQRATSDRCSAANSARDVVAIKHASCGPHLAWLSGWIFGIAGPMLAAGPPSAGHGVCRRIQRAERGMITERY